MLESQSEEINDILNRVFSKNKKHDQNIIDIYDYFLVSYGYIPYKDFLNMDALLVEQLMKRINKRNEEANKKAKAK